MSKHKKKGHVVIMRRFTEAPTKAITMRATPPIYPHIAAGLWKLSATYQPNSSARAIEIDGKLEEAKMRLQSVGVRNLNQVGNLSIHENREIRPGLIAPAGFRSEVLRDMRDHSDFGYMTATVPTLAPTESLIIADKLDLTNATLVIDRNHVTHLWIVVRSFIAAQGAHIRYRPEVHEAVGNKGIDGSLAWPNFNPGECQSSTGHFANNGGDGGSGGEGFQGPAGLNAPDLTVCALEVDAMPDIHLSGQEGGRGGAGGRGADGGNGQRGRTSKSGFWACEWGCGYGGNGGRGGDGGKGGRGGAGGRGGNVTFATQEKNLAKLVTARAFILNNGPGNGGKPGPHGDPGIGGGWGEAGCNAGGHCDPEPDRHGQKGSNGQIPAEYPPIGDTGAEGTLAYDVITEDEWNEKLNGPWLVSLQPNSSFAGDTIVAHGLNFVRNSEVLIGTRSSPATFLSEKEISFTIPNDLEGRRYLVQVRTPDGDISNEVELALRPYINEVAGEFSPGGKIDILGTAFAAGAVILVDGNSLLTQWESITHLTGILPFGGPITPGGTMIIVVRNPDGLESNASTATRRASLDSGFRASRHGYGFNNFSIGNPSWETFLQTFGSEEVAGQILEHPIFTGAFFQFYKWFLGGRAKGGGHCSGIAATSLQRFNQGKDGLYNETTMEDNKPYYPPSISPALLARLDITQGRVLSRELILHYAEQSKLGVDSIEKAIRAIEGDFRNGLGENSARILCFIPSGTIWEIFADETVRDAFMASHAVVPTRIVYKDQSGSLNGARLYVYENNAKRKDIDYFLQLESKGGKIHFKYNFNSKINSDNGFTLGTATLQEQLLTDVDLPFSGNGGLDSFILDLILSPANICVEDISGKIVGHKDGKWYSDGNLGYICPWAPNYMLVRPGSSHTRTVTGIGNGKYTYSSIHPNGKSIALRDVPCSSNTVDVISTDANLKQITIQSNESRPINFHIAESLSNGEIRHIELSYNLTRNVKSSLVVEQELNGGSLAPQMPANIHVGLRKFQGNVVIEEAEYDAQVLPGKRLILPQQMWGNINNVTFRVV
jgi:hypothetical protein